MKFRIIMDKLVKSIRCNPPKKLVCFLFSLDLNDTIIFYECITELVNLFLIGVAAH